MSRFEHLSSDLSKLFSGEFEWVDFIERPIFWRFSAMRKHRAVAATFEHHGFRLTGDVVKFIGYDLTYPVSFDFSAPAAMSELALILASALQDQDV
jgi:hypothetical protein